MEIGQQFTDMAFILIVGGLAGAIFVIAISGFIKGIFKKDKK